jgi:hypothetical protein
VSVARRQNGRVLLTYRERLVADSTDRVAWLRARSRGITATDVAKLSTPRSIDVAATAKLHGTNFSGNRYTDHGRIREPEIARWVAATHGIRPSSALYHAAEERRHLATPDGLAETHDGRLLLCEIKTTAKAWRSIPRHYLRQVWWQQYVLGAERTLVVWEQHQGFVPVDDEPLSAWVDRDDREIRSLVDEGRSHAAGATRGLTPDVGVGIRSADADGSLARSGSGRRAFVDEAGVKVDDGAEEAGDDNLLLRTVGVGSRAHPGDHGGELLEGARHGRRRRRDDDLAPIDGMRLPLHMTDGHESVDDVGGRRRRHLETGGEFARRHRAVLHEVLHGREVGRVHLEARAQPPLEALRELVDLPDEHRDRRGLREAGWELIGVADPHRVRLGRGRLDRLALYCHVRHANTCDS